MTRHKELFLNKGLKNINIFLKKEHGPEFFQNEKKLNFFRGHLLSNKVSSMKNLNLERKKMKMKIILSKIYFKMLKIVKN